MNFINKKIIGYTVGAFAALYIVYVSAVGLISSPGGDPYIPPVLDENASNKDRAVVMSEALSHSLQTQLDSFFGFLPNDLMLVPTIIDNTTSYQKGVIYATRPGSDMIAKTVARFGKTDTIDSRLADATSRFFTYSENVWGFWFIYDAENKYREGIAKWKDWAASVDSDKKNVGIYNVKSDDVYNILKYCQAMIDYSLGILNNEKMGHFDSDDNIFYVKGVVSVVSDILRGLIAVDSSVIERGGRENVDEAMKRLNYIQDFNPLYVVAGGNEVGDAMLPNHVAAMARHLDVANNRIADMMQSMEK